MTKIATAHAIPEASPEGDDGVRVIRTDRSSDVTRRWIGVVVILIVGLSVLAVWVAREKQSDRDPVAALSVVDTSHEQGSEATRPLSTVTTLPRAMRRVAAPMVAAAMPDLPEATVYDPNDLSNYIRPGDPEPTMGELITALNEAGIHEGLGAFNPPGTSPPLPGLGVPDDFLLPPGYVRHHQVTDQGETIPPILMFSPDYDFFDDEGHRIAIPENRVVPAELAPDGMPIEWVGVPDP